MKRFLVLCACAMLGGFVAVRVAQAARDPAGPYRKLDVFSHVLSLVENNYVEPVDEAKLVYGAIDGMIHTLDPHSSFMDPRSYAALKEETEGEYGGVGLELATRGDDVVVVAPIDDTPASRAGFQPGDRLIEIDGRTVHVYARARRGPAGLRGREALRSQAGVCEDQDVPGPDGRIPAQVARLAAGGSRRTGRRPGPRSAPQSRRTAGSGGEGRRSFPGRRRDRHHQGPQRQERRGGESASEERRAALPDDRAGGRRHGQRERDRRRRASGFRPRSRDRHADVRQGLGADGHRARGWFRPQADHRPVLHALRAQHPGARDHAGRLGEGERGGRRRSAGAEPARALQG